MRSRCHEHCATGLAFPPPITFDSRYYVHSHDSFLDSFVEIRVLPGGPIWMMMIMMMMMEMVMEIAIVTDGKYVHLSLKRIV